MNVVGHDMKSYENGNDVSVVSAPRGLVLCQPTDGAGPAFAIPGYTRLGLKLRNSNTENRIEMVKEPGI